MKKIGPTNSIQCHLRYFRNRNRTMGSDDNSFVESDLWERKRLIRFASKLRAQNCHQLRNRTRFHQRNSVELRLQSPSSSVCYWMDKTCGQFRPIILIHLTFPRFIRSSFESAVFRRRDHEETKRANNDETKQNRYIINSMNFSVKPHRLQSFNQMGKKFELPVIT